MSSPTPPASATSLFAPEGSTAGTSFSSSRQALVPEPPGALYEPELEMLCRIAASVGSEERGPAPLSFTALLIAFLFAEDPVSRWFQGFVAPPVSIPRSIDVASIYRSKNVTAESRPIHLQRAQSGVLPVAHPLFSVSARRMLEAAQTFAREQVGTLDTEPRIGTRHLMAAFVHRVPSDHRDQLRGWGFDAGDWAAAFDDFVKSSDPAPLPTTSVPPPTPTTFIGSYTADNPFAINSGVVALDDLLDIEDEAAAFARIAAATGVSPPLAIGVFGEWGAGKTYFMKRIYDHIERLKETPSEPSTPEPFHKQIVQIRFDAWHYIETNLWASLVECIFTALDRWLMEHSGHDRSEADRVFDRLATAQQLKLDALEDVVSRRAERRGAELRAERARREYEQALAESNVIQPEAYFSALLGTLLDQQEVKKNLKDIGASLGIDELEDSRARLAQVLEEAKTERGRVQIIGRSALAKFGTWRWIFGAIAVLFGFPFLAAFLKDLAAAKFPWMHTVHDGVVGVAALLTAATGMVGTLLRGGSRALDKLDGLRKKLEDKVKDQQRAAAQAGAAMQAQDAETELKKRRQALETAERALVEADARFTDARRDFETASARGRLNAFIRAKATDDKYAKHLGIIAAIRKDFAQLTSMMTDAHTAAEEQRERDRLAIETKERVEQFLQWLGKTREMRLTAAELRSVFALLQPTEAAACFDKWRPQFTRHFDGADQELLDIRADLEKVATTPLPSFSRIILYIDDLDRCPTATVVEVLQAVHLLLSFPLFVVLVAVDARWVSRALSKEYPNLLVEPSPSCSEASAKTAEFGASPHDYMEKIFQIPYWVRSMTAPLAERYVRSIASRDLAAPKFVGLPPPPTHKLPTQTPLRAPTSISAANIITSDSSSTGKPTPAPTLTSTPTPPAAVNTPSVQSIIGGLTLTDWEVKALEGFAPFVGATPRRAIRFVNLYRLIKTSLPPETLKNLVGEHGESRTYRALIAQLAIVTGAPQGAVRYFVQLGLRKAEDPVHVLRSAVLEDKALVASGDAGVINQILTKLNPDEQGLRIADSIFRVGELQSLAATAQRYSFATPPARSL